MNPGHAESSSRVSRSLTILAVFATHLAALILVIFVLCAIVPEYVKFFAKMGVELPQVTQQVIQLSSIAVQYWYLILLLAAIADATIVWLFASLDASQRWLLTAYSHLCLLATITFLVWVAMAIGYPVIAISEAVAL